jgi:hypothetical protein
MSDSIFVRIIDISSKELESLNKKIQFCNYSVDGDKGVVLMEKDLKTFYNITKNSKWEVGDDISDGFYKLKLINKQDVPKEVVVTLPKIDAKKEKENVANICNNNVDKKIQSLIESADSLKNNIIRFNRSLKDETERNSVLSYNLLKTSKSNKYSEEFDNLLKIKSIKNIRIDGEKIVVWTNMIYCKDDRHGTIHEIGEFKIMLNIDKEVVAHDDGDNSSIVVYENLTRKVTNNEFDGMEAPHVFDSGRACWGNHYKLIRNLAINNEIIPLILQSIRFLEYANTRDAAGSQVCAWPYKNEKVSSYKRRIIDTREYNGSMCGECKFRCKCRNVM